MADGGIGGGSNMTKSTSMNAAADNETGAAASGSSNDLVTAAAPKRSALRNVCNYFMILC